MSLSMARFCADRLCPVRKVPGSARLLMQLHLFRTLMASSTDTTVPTSTSITVPIPTGTTSPTHSQTPTST